MKKTRSKVLAVAMSVVLAFSMTSAAALQAFASELTAGVSSLAVNSGIVYDDAYGVFAGKYALMTKSVTSDTQYATITDIVRADGTVAVHASTAAQGQQGVPGDYAEYRLGSVNTYATDVAAGYVKLTSKASGKTGLRRVEGGSWLIPCAYDALQEDPLGGGFIGFSYGVDSVTATFLNADATPFGNAVEIAASVPEGGYRSAYAYGERYGVLNISVSTSEGSTDVYLERTESGYQVMEGVASIRGDGWGDDGSMLYEGTDGGWYYRPASGPEVKVNVDNIDICWLEGGFICAETDDDSGSGYVYCVVSTGNPVNIGNGRVESKKGGLLLVEYEREVQASDEADDPYTYIAYTIYDATGNSVYVSEEGEELYLVGLSRFVKRVRSYSDAEDSYSYTLTLHNSNGALVKSIGTFDRWPNISSVGDEVFTVATTRWAYASDDDDEGVSYRTLRAYSVSSGNLLKDFGERQTDRIYLSEVESYSASAKSDVLVGYCLQYYQKGSYQYEYYDTQFNSVSSRPSLGGSDSGSGNQPSLMFAGKPLSVTMGYSSSDGKYVAKVAYTSGGDVTVGGYKLGIATDNTSYFWWNSVKRGSNDVWWATNSAGKWGAINSSGGVIVPFEYDSYFDRGASDTSYALVKKNGVWDFLQVGTSVIETPADSAQSGAGTTPSSNAASTDAETGVTTGATVKVGGATYKVTDASAATVSYQAPPKSKKAATVPASVTINGKKYAVTGIAKNAFKKSKAKTVTIRSAKLTKKGVKGCFKGSKVKVVKVKVGGKKANKKAIKKYKKYFTKANCGAKVTLK